MNEKNGKATLESFWASVVLGQKIMAKVFEAVPRGQLFYESVEFPVETRHRFKETEQGSDFSIGFTDIFCLTARVLKFRLMSCPSRKRANVLLLSDGIFSPDLEAGRVRSVKYVDQPLPLALNYDSVNFGKFDPQDRRSLDLAYGGERLHKRHPVVQMARWAFCDGAHTAS